MFDLAISFDSTGSMYPCLSEVRRVVDKTVQKLFTEVVNLRIAIIAHGDYCDAYTRYVTKTLDFTDNQQAIADFVRNVAPTDGGDSDECYERVLHEMRSLNWRHDAIKSAIVIGDCEPHERGYRYGSIRVDIDWREEAKELVNAGIHLYGVQCLGRRVSFYDKIAQIANTPKINLNQFTNIVPLLTALAYRQQSVEKVKAYADELKVEGLFNRDLANIIASITGDTSQQYTKNLSVRISSDLIPVAPSRFQVLHVDTDTDIKTFVQSTGALFRKGKGFYQLTKREEIQENKEVVLVDRNGDMFTGDKARYFINLPYGMRGYVYPPSDKSYKVFVQSTSVNRKLTKGTQFLYEVDLST